MLPFAVQESLSAPRRAILMAGLAGPSVALFLASLLRRQQSVRRISFSHSSAEIWRDGRLMSLRSETVEHGETLYVEGAAMPDGFRVVSKGGPFIASAATCDCPEKL
ncbi:MAG: DUF6134 family protein [Steroidobacteraceae bacterium]|jgi:uncharacterized protein DUF6134